MNRLQIRKIVYNKYNGHCAYCGYEIGISDMQVDHIYPQSRVRREKNIDFNVHHIDNLNPACRVCNKWKSDFSVEQFRIEIMMQLDRIKRDSAGVRMCLKYGLISFTPREIKFYFEIHPPFGIKGLNTMEVVNG